MRISRRYDSDFYRRQVAGSLASAAEVVPLILEHLQVSSVLDVGCGVGSWLAVFKNAGSTVVGLDGDYVPRHMLMIDDHEFAPTNLESPLPPRTRVDLVMSLEVAEHLPRSRAASFVDDLTSLADRVLFSAAIPNQTGLHHINEQWQSYWADLFAKRGYLPVDFIRPQVWENTLVDWWYAQNMILYVSDADFAHFSSHRNMPLDLVHPRSFGYGRSIGRREAARRLILGSGADKE